MLDAFEIDAMSSPEYGLEHAQPTFGLLNSEEAHHQSRREDPLFAGLPDLEPSMEAPGFPHLSVNSVHYTKPEE